MKKLSTLLIFTLLILLNINIHAAAGVISKQQAVSIAKQAHPGRILAVKLKSTTYKVKTLSDDGRVRFIYIDANTGKIQSGNKTSGNKAR